MPDNTPETTSGAELGAWIVREHNARRGYVIDGPTHALTMLLADLIDYADSVTPRADFDAAIAAAREMFAEESANR